jgi:hypothetical protein
MGAVWVWIYLNPSEPWIESLGSDSFKGVFNKSLQNAKIPPKAHLHFANTKVFKN